MKKVLFLVKSYSTHNRQNALCIEYVAKYMLEEGCDVDYLSYEFSKIKRQPHIIPCYIQKESGKLYYKLYKLFHIPIENSDLVKAYYNSIKAQISKKDYDAIIAVINPPETAEALYRIKKEYPKINFILYEIDPNSNRYKISRSIKERVWRYFSLRWEKKIYDKADTIIHMRTHQKHYMTDYFSSYFSKTMFLDIPNFVPVTISSDRKKDVNEVSFLYAGAFYPKLREPYYMLELFRLLSKTILFKLDIFTGNSMKKRITQIAENQKYTFVHDEISQEKLLEKISKADILISIGNKESDFLPSKTLMYMSTGKPIIHFYSDSNDVSLQYFKHYPHVLLIDQTKKIDTELLKNVFQFIKRVYRKPLVNYEYMHKYLLKNTPQYSATKIMEKI